MFSIHFQLVVLLVSATATITYACCCRGPFMKVVDERGNKEERIKLLLKAEWVVKGGYNLKDSKAEVTREVTIDFCEQKSADTVSKSVREESVKSSLKGTATVGAAKVEAEVQHGVTWTDSTESSQHFSHKNCTKKVDVTKFPKGENTVFYQMVYFSSTRSTQVGLDILTTNNKDKVEPDMCLHIKPQNLNYVLMMKTRSSPDGPYLKAVGESNADVTYGTGFPAQYLVLDTTIDRNKAATDFSVESGLYPWSTDDRAQYMFGQTYFVTHKGGPKHIVAESVILFRKREPILNEMLGYDFCVPIRQNSNPQSKEKHLSVCYNYFE